MPATAASLNLKEDITSIKSDETSKNSNKTAHPAGTLKLDKSKLFKGNVINFDDYYKKLNLLKSQLKSNNIIENNNNNNDNFSSKENNNMQMKLNSNNNSSNSKKIFKSDLFGNKSDSKNKGGIVDKRDSKIFDYKKFLLKNTLHEKGKLDHAYNSASGKKIKITFFTYKLINLFIHS